MEDSNIAQECRQAAIDYKKDIAGKFVLVEGAKLKSRLQGSDFCVSRKLDGHMQAVFWRDGKAFMLNSQGRQKADGLGCLNALGEALTKAGIQSATVIAELYAPNEGGRERCGDVGACLADPARRNSMRLAPFDLVELEGEPWKPSHYKETHAKLVSLFDNEMVQPVPMKAAASLDEVQAIYKEWVEGDGAEGVVVHADFPYIWKVKPRHSIDAAVIGYTTGDKGVRDLMLAARREDGLFQMFAVGSGALADDDRAALLSELSPMAVDSTYVLSDSRGIAYQMVRPGPVYEVSVIELVVQDSDGKPKTNPLLRFDEAAGWSLECVVPGARALGLAFNRRRDDKLPNETDIRISQLTDIAPFVEASGDSSARAPSELLARRVFKKEQKGKVMLHKFVLWKTNKEAGGRFPAFVLYHTDFSSSRKDLIKRDMMFSSDEKQIRELMDGEIARNIKKGWDEIVS